MTRPSVFEFAGGEPAFLALAAAHHERCLADPVLIGSQPPSRAPVPRWSWDGLQEPGPA
jgi:hypothetical protein